MSCLRFEIVNAYGCLSGITTDRNTHGDPWARKKGPSGQRAGLGRSARLLFSGGYCVLRNSGYDGPIVISRFSFDQMSDRGIREDRVHGEECG